MLAAVATDVESAAGLQRLQEKEEGLSRELDRLVHRAGAIDQENVLLVLGRLRWHVDIIVG